MLMKNKELTVDCRVEKLSHLLCVERVTLRLPAISPPTERLVRADGVAKSHTAQAVCRFVILWTETGRSIFARTLSRRLRGRKCHPQPVRIHWGPARASSLYILLAGKAMLSSSTARSGRATAPQLRDVRRSWCA